MMEGLGKTIALALTTMLAPQANRRTTGSNMANAISVPITLTNPPLVSCYYCRGSHMVACCEKAAEDLQKGLLKQNKEGRLVLSNSLALPAFRKINGNSPCERIWAWHEQNLAVTSNNIVIIGEPDNAPVTMEDRFAQLEMQIMELWKQRAVFDGVEIPSVPKVAKQVAQPQKPLAANSKPLLQTPVHPYAMAKDASRLPKPLTLSPQVATHPTNPTFDKVYRTTAPAYNPSMAGKVFTQSLKAPSITLTPEELLTISPDVRAKYCNLVMPKRVAAANSNNTAALVAEFGDLEFEGQEEDAEEVGNYIQAPINPTETIVAKDSHALRSVNTLIGGRELVKCTLDPGCQVILMLEAICHALGLAYDERLLVTVQGGAVCGL